MNSQNNHPLSSFGPLTGLAISQGISHWEALTNHVSALPYGRNSNRHEFSLVLAEKKGTCSSKHALLKMIAVENNLQNIQLVLGIYKMSQSNTAKIGNVLSKNELDYIPEAHCYLKINGLRKDFTSSTSDIKNIEKDILLETEIDAKQVIQYKIDYHKSYIRNWIEEQKINYTFDEIWALRELCIKNLSSV